MYIESQSAAKGLESQEDAVMIDANDTDTTDEANNFHLIAQEEMNLTMAKEHESSSSSDLANQEPANQEPATQEPVYQEEDRATKMQRMVKEPVSFVVEKKLGSGGQAQVYLATQGELSRDQVNGAQINTNV